jgi:hypothetical protein
VAEWIGCLIVGLHLNLVDLNLILSICDCVKWYCNCSAQDCWMEEKEILEEEMKHTIKHFNFMKITWTTMAMECHVEESGYGKAAYANRQAGMYQHFEKNIIMYEKKACGKGDMFAAWLEKHQRNLNQTLDSEYSE